MSKDLNEVLNYMKQYVENKYEHDSEPMLNYKDLQLVLEEIKRLNNIINKAIEYITRNCYKVCDKQLYGIPIMSIKLDNADNLLQILKGEDNED